MTALDCIVASRRPFAAAVLLLVAAAVLLLVAAAICILSWLLVVAGKGRDCHNGAES